MLISDPFDDPAFLPTARVVGGLLAASLVLLLLITRGNPARLRQHVLFHRWLVWAAIAPLYTIAVLGGRLPALALVAVLVFQGLREYARLVGLPDDYRRLLLLLGTLTPIVALLSPRAFHALPAACLLLATLQPLLFRERAASIRHLAFAALGWGYVAWFLTYLLLLQARTPGGPGLLLAIGLAVALSDVGAFVVGKRFGRHKLAPSISPNKTWEGAAGNLLGAAVGIVLMRFALPPGQPWLQALLPCLVAIGSLWGDLLESSIKREFSAKDAGVWLPGFGGLLDRIDSLIVVVPLTWFVLGLVS